MADGTPASFVPDAPSVPPSFVPDPVPASQTVQPSQTAAQQPSFGDRAKNIIQGGLNFLRDTHGSKFEQEVISGMGFDAQKIASQPTVGAQWGEVGKQAASGLGNFLLSLVKDPTNISKIVEAPAAGIEQGIKEKSPGKVLGAASQVLGAAETPGKLSDVAAASSKAGIVQSSHAMLNSAAADAKMELSRVKAAVGNRVGELTTAISNADSEASASMGKVGSISVPQAYEEMIQTQQKVDPAMSKMPTADKAAKLMADQFGGQLADSVKIPFEQAKSLRTDIGYMARNVKVPSERAVLDATYANLTDQMKARADELGMSDKFEAYNQLHRVMMDYAHDNGILGKLFKADTGLDFFKELAKPSNGPELASLNKDLGQFGLAANFFNDLKAAHKNTFRLARVAESGEGSTLQGKIKAVGAHPIAAGSAFVTAASLPLPGKYVVSLLAASKAADYADRVAAAAEIRKQGGAPPIEGKFGAAAGVQ